ncbi:MAG TPA: GH116 family glycosyl hydrolase [Fimbriimonas sp.]|nr:GH116 family glycosyl hydrolase [Fimbriimonas sp.]
MSKQPSITRRNLLSGTAAAVGASGLTGTAVATPSRKPANLEDRGAPESYTNEEQRYVGMPIGGCFAGTVYLGGDGQLWNWDIFNAGQVGAVSQPNLIYLGDQVREQDGANYVRPPIQTSPFRQRFDLHVDNGSRPNPAIPMGLSVKFGEVTFRGEYPVGQVQYRRGDSDVEMDLEAFSPFIPLDIDRSSFPATSMTFTVRNVGKNSERCSLRYVFENPVLCLSKAGRTDFEYTHQKSGNGVVVGASRLISRIQLRPDILFEDWSSGSYEKWVVTGTAFGTAPRRVADLPSYMGNIQAGTPFVVNSHQTRNGEDVTGGDVHTGTLASPAFTIQSSFINVRIGGGAHKGRTCISLIVDGKQVASLTGNNDNRMTWKSMSVKSHIGSEAQLVIIDAEAGAWGNIGIGEIVFSDAPRDGKPLEALGDFGSFGVSVLGGGAEVDVSGQTYTVRKDFELAPGESRQITFFVAWHFPNKPTSVPGDKHWYATRWSSAQEVLQELETKWTSLRDTTKLWRKTWYDSTLPYWFLDRTFANLSTLATTTCYRLGKEGRFYFWEGVGCCAGTCTHVWGYAQGIARIFPEVERYLREQIDFGEFFNASGAIDYRGEYARSVAHDGQLSCILRFYREHLMSKDSSLLNSRWTQVKKALEFIISEDRDQDGILEGAQYNTLDAAWYGPIAWISSLYVAALRAGESMARLQGDEEFAKRCQALAESGSKHLVGQLYNGDYFINRPDLAHPEANNTNIGCHIDQLYGQFWAAQLKLPRVVPAKEGKKAMASLFKHNFYKDIWDYRSKVRGIQGGRWYAMPGESGLIMCTFPKGGATEATGKGHDAWAAAYFNECMSGFEYQAAANMISEGLVREGLSVVRAIHDRYSATKRNPYNEVECSDHYGRAMASYGAYIALTGMHIDSPKNVVEIAPKINRGKARCAFVDAHGWGTVDNTSGKTVRTYHYKVS